MFRRWGGEIFDASVLHSVRITPSIHKIIVKKPGSFSFLPVQFTFLSLMTSEGIDTRPMSIATSPSRPNLEYAVRLSDSYYKQAFGSLKRGGLVRVQGPFGDFFLNEKRPAVLIAGGIGITPLKGMAEYASDRRLNIPVRLLYSNRSEDEIAYRAELQELEVRNLNFKVFNTLTGKEIPNGWRGSKGRIDQDLVRLAVDSLKRPIYYLCGKPSMVSAVFNMLLQMGIPEEDVNYEVFRGYWN